MIPGKYHQHGAFSMAMLVDRSVKVQEIRRTSYPTASFFGHRINV